MCEIDLKQEKGDTHEERYKPTVYLPSWWAFRKQIERRKSDQNLQDLGLAKSGCHVSDTDFEVTCKIFKVLAMTNHGLFRSLCYGYGCLQSIQEAEDNPDNDLAGFLIVKATQEFYYRMGQVLNAIARIVYIIFFTGAPDVNKVKMMDYGELKKKYRRNANEFHPLSMPLSQRLGNSIEEILNLRHNITHYWNVYCMAGRTADGKFRLAWSETARKVRGSDWSSAESVQNPMVVSFMASSDFETVKKFVSELFDQSTSSFDSWMVRMKIVFEAEIDASGNVPSNKDASRPSGDTPFAKNGCES